MKRTLLLSLLLNLLLTGGVLYQAATPPRVSLARLFGWASAETNSISEMQKTSEAQSFKTNFALPVTSAPAFHWNRLEAADYKTFITNLRAIGCPAATIRDLVMADLEEHIRQRRDAVVRPLQPKFWNFVAKGEKGMETMKEALKPVNEENEALRAEVEKLLGAPEPKPKSVDNFSRLDFLPPEKRTQYLELQERVAQMKRDVEQLPEDERPARLKAISKELEQAKRALLTPEEYEENRLRSQLGDWGKNLAGFEPTTEELRAVARLKLTAADAAISADDTNQNDSPDQAKQKLNQQIKDTLGPERYAEYQRAQNGYYGEALRLSERLNLPAETAREAFEIRSTVQTQVAQLNERTDLSDDQRTAALRAILAETQRTLKRTWGDANWPAYLKNGGDWLKQLAP